MNDTPIKTNLDEQNLDTVLRPSSFDEYIGQDTVKKSLKIILEAAKLRKEPIDHILFYGQAGLGKTTLANIVANELGGNLKITSGPAIEKSGDLAAILTNLEAGDVLFIDEIHRLNRMIEEVLYPAMESRQLNIVIGKGPAARTISLDLPPFTLIAATTRVNMISNPLRSRFGASFRLDYYSVPDISEIIRRSASLVGINLDESAIGSLAKASRFTPRIANRLVRRARDLAEVRKLGLIKTEDLSDLFKILDIDEYGLEYQDRRLLDIISEQFNGGPVGINSLAAALGDDRDIIEDIYEPYLINLGFLKRTSGGRVISEKGIEYLKKNHDSQN